MLKKISQISNKTKKNFCIFAPYMSPERHINMSHNPQNCYEEVIQLGDYPIAPVYNDKVFSRKYEQPLLNLIAQFIKQKNPSLNFDPTQYEHYQFSNWSDLGISLEEDKTELLEFLANNLYVSENKFRYLIEQKNRLQFSSHFFQTQDLNNYFIHFFVENYLDIIRVDSEKSNLWRAPNIVGSKSPIEKFYEQNDINQGVADLNDDIPENKTFINRLLRIIH